MKRNRITTDLFPNENYEQESLGALKCITEKYILYRIVSFLIADPRDALHFRITCKIFYFVLRDFVDLNEYKAKMQTILTSIGEEDHSAEDEEDHSPEDREKLLREVCNLRLISLLYIAGTEREEYRVLLKYRNELGYRNDWIQTLAERAPPFRHTILPTRHSLANVYENRKNAYFVCSACCSLGGAVVVILSILAAVVFLLYTFADLEQAYKILSSGIAYRTRYNIMCFFTDDNDYCILRRMMCPNACLATPSTALKFLAVTGTFAGIGIIFSVVSFAVFATFMALGIHMACKAKKKQSVVENIFNLFNETRPNQEDSSQEGSSDDSVTSFTSETQPFLENVPG